jgi:simple sugar transport system ATP-binding protein
MQAATDPSRPAIELSSITKRFPGVVANRDVSLAFRRGEIHALLGENGAGKSTLIGMLSGMLQPDAGTIKVGGATVTIDSPRRALDLGIGTVYQHVTLVPTLTVLENLMLGGAWAKPLDRVATRRRLGEIAATLGIAVEADTGVGRLSLGEQQQIEIIKALWSGEQVLILDEPTSMLTPRGVEELGRVMTRLRNSGVAIIFITHKLREAIALGDRIAVLQRGRLVGEIPPDRLRSLSPDVATELIVGLMFESGGERASGSEDLRRPVPLDPALAPILELERVGAAGEPGEPSIDSVGFSLRPGEIFGIAGIDGNGQKQLAELIAGQRRLERGEIRLAGRPIGRLGVRARQALGLRYLTDDRLGEGTVPILSVALNMVVKRIGEAPFWRNGMIDTGAIDTYAKDLIRHHDIRTPSEHTPIGRLSGGNIQKVLLGRELYGRPQVMMFNKPTYGLDLQNIDAARRAMRTQADAGTAILLLSTDLDELLVLCDRIGVMLNGRLQGVVDNDDAAARAVGQLMTGAAA